MEHTQEKSASMSVDRLFQPLKVGNIELSHRLVMAPLSRHRAGPGHQPSPLAKTYYEQRASTPGTLIITEGTFVSPRASGFSRVPGIWSKSHIAAWKEIVDAIPKQGSSVFCQLWVLGRVASAKALSKEEGGPYEVSAPSAIPLAASVTFGYAPTAMPHALSEDGIQASIRDFAQAAANAMEAGFDGVELLGGNGYLIDQFLQDVTNHRTDAWGGSVEKRARFALETVKAVIEAVGDSRKVAMRLSPYNEYQEMGMEDPVPQFNHLIRELKELDLAYLHLVENRVAATPEGPGDAEYNEAGTKELKVFIDAWSPEAPVVLSGGYTPEKATWAINQFANDAKTVFSFGRPFISTPDLPYRVKNGLPLNKYDRRTFYTRGAKGYIDYEFSEEWEAEHALKARL